MKCQLCEFNEAKWAVIVPMWEYLPVQFILIEEGKKYNTPYWLICDLCQETGKVYEERRRIIEYAANNRNI